MRLTLTAATLAACAQPALSQCTPHWDDRFNYAALDGEVFASAVFDDGTGPALYIGGTFRNYLGTPLSGIARWDGQTFRPVGNLLSATVRALVVWDADGPGPNPPALYAGGVLWQTLHGVTSSHRVARWNGQIWSGLGLSTSAVVRALCVHNDTFGEKLVVGGTFNGLPLNNLAAYSNLTGWTSMNGGVTDTDNSVSVQALVSVNDPEGPILYVGGDFSHAGGVPARAIARLQNGQWTGLGAGLTFDAAWFAYPIVYALAAANLPSTGGPCIVAGGWFDHADGLPVGGLAKWSGTSWSPLQYTSFSNWGNVRMLRVADLGAGPALYASTFEGLERWNGATWDLVGPGVSGATSMSVDTQSPQPRAYLTGTFLRADQAAAPGVASYDGTSFSGIGAVGHGLNGPVKAFTAGDLGQGHRLYAVGDFTHGSDLHLNHSAVWTGASWAPIGSGLPDTGSDFRGTAIHDPGSGPHLYAAERLRGIYKLDAGLWQQLGELQGSTLGVLSFDPDDAGPQPSALFAIGSLNVGPAVTPIVRWTGTQWINAFTPNPAGVPAAVAAHAFDPDGPGPQPTSLYLAGQFHINGEYCMIAKWDGASWTAQAPQHAAPPEFAFAFTVHDDGTGPALYAAGSFSNSTLVRLVGDQWQAYGAPERPFPPGLDPFSSFARALVSVDRGTRPELIMAGFFAMGYGGIIVLRDGAWEPYEHSVSIQSMTPSTTAATVFDDGSTPALFVSGNFTHTTLPDGSAGPASRHIARLSLCRSGCTADFDGDGDIATDADIEAFFACLAGNCCPTCSPRGADFDGDGDTATDADIEAFFRVLAGGAC